MKSLKTYLLGFGIFAMLLFSCSKEDPGVLQNQNPEKATLSFGAVLDDLMDTRSALKQSLSDYPECTDDTPSYVTIVLSLDGTDVVGSEETPFRVDLVDNQIFTQEVAELELEPGMYSLDYFAVYNEDNELIWLAPRSSSFAGFVDHPLPLDIELLAGVKKYVDVSVLCFDNRFVNEYGYLFFDLAPVQVIEFCIFGNYCDPTGRHYPAAFSVSVWNYADGIQGSLLHSSVSNSVTMNDDGDYAGTTVCVTLPDTAGLDEYYFEITLLNSDAYGAVQQEVIRSGVITDEEVRALFVGDDSNEYYHFRAGCTGQDSPDLFDEGGGTGECDPNDSTADCDGDGVPNAIDQCPGTPPGVDVDEYGCESVSVPGRDVVVFNDIDIFRPTAMADPDNIRLVQNLVNYSTTGSRNNGNVVMFDRGRNARCISLSHCDNTNLAEMRNVISNEGFTITDIFSTSGSLVEIASNVKVIFLFMPTLQYTVAEINALKSFAAQGGRIVFVGEYEGYYEHINIQNQFLLNMGAVLHNTGGAVDCGITVLPQSSNREHPIMEGIVNLTIACASVIEPGDNDFALFYDTTNTHVLAGVAKIDTAPITQLRAADVSQTMQAPKDKSLTTTSSTGF